MGATTLGDWAASSIPEESAFRKNRGTIVTVKSRSTVWTAASLVLIVLGGVVTPVAITAFWARGLLTSSDTFVATFAPLAKDPEVQTFLATELTDTITSSLDLPSVTGEIVDGIVELGTSARATAALRVLQGSVTAVLEGLIFTSVEKFVRSDGFATIWRESLRITHTGLVGALSGREDAVFVVGDDSTLGVNVRPVLERLKVALVGEGLTFAAELPVTNTVIVIARSDALPAAMSAYAIAVAIGLWIPVLALVLLAGGVLLGNRRIVALRWAATAAAIGTGLLLLLEAAGRWVFIAIAPPVGLPGPVATTMYDQVLSGVGNLTAIVFGLGLITATVAWVYGPGATPTAIREWFSSRLSRSTTADAIQ